MSYLLNKNLLRVYLTSDELVICTLNGLLRPTVTMQQKVPIHNSTVDSTNTTILTAMETWLQTTKLQTGTRVEWILGLSHVRHILVPWTPKLVDQAFRQSIADAIFGQQFHEDATNYQACFSKISIGKPVIVAYVDSKLLSGIKLLADSYNHQIKSIKPLLMLVWNQLDSLLSKENSQLHIWENQRVLKITNVFGHIQQLELWPINNTIIELQPSTDNNGKLTRVFPAIGQQNLFSRHANQGSIIANQQSTSNSDKMLYSVAMYGI